MLASTNTRKVMKTCPVGQILLRPFAILLIAFIATNGYGQKLTIAPKVGKVIQTGVFSFSESTSGVEGFKSTYRGMGTVAWGLNLEYRVNKRFSMEISPEFIFDRGKMDIVFEGKNGGTLSTIITNGYRTIVIPYCVGYHFNLKKNALPLKLVGGISYTRFGLSYEKISGIYSSNSNTGSASGSITGNSSFTAANSLGYVFGVELYPSKKYSKVGLYGRYYGLLNSGAFNKSVLTNAYQTDYASGTESFSFEEKVSFRPSNIVVGILYKFGLKTKK